MTREEIDVKRALVKAQVKRLCDLVLAIEKSLDELPEAERKKLEDEVEELIKKI